jgi:transposase
MKFYSINDVIDRFGIHRNTITNMMQDGRLIPVNPGKPPYYFDERQIKRFLAAIREAKWFKGRFKNKSVNL